MARDIKFRAWDDTKKEWTLNIMECVSSCTSNIWMEPALKSHEVVIEQYTGLKDKNGKEIYEGDIIKDTSDGDCLINEVFWCEKGAFWGVKPKSSFADREWGWFIGRDNIEVIGNIHETPGLLEGEKDG